MRATAMDGQVWLKELPPKKKIELVHKEALKHKRVFEVHEDIMEPLLREHKVMTTLHEIEMLLNRTKVVRDNGIVEGRFVKVARQEKYTHMGMVVMSRWKFEKV